MVKIDGLKSNIYGTIPTEWEVCTIEKYIKIETGIKNTEDKTCDGKYPFYVRSQKVERIDSYSYDTEAVITAGDGVGTGKIFHYINGKFNAHQRVYVMTNFSEISGKYFYYFFSNNFFNEVSKYTAKSSVDSVRRDMIAKMLIPIPSMEEQKSIAEALEDIDNLILSIEKLIEKKKAIMQGTIQELLTGKKRLDGFTDEWIDTTIGAVCDVFDGTHQTPRYVEKGIPFYSVENVTNNEFKSIKYISPEEHEVLTKSRRIEKGDILMTRIGSIGVCKYIDWDVNASYYVSLALIKCKKVNAKFLTAYSSTRNFQNEIELNSLPSATPKKINLGPISDIKIRIPKTEEEQKILADIAFDLDSEITSLESKLSKYRQIKQGMMQELLTGRIRLI